MSHSSSRTRCLSLLAALAAESAWLPLAVHCALGAWDGERRGFLGLAAILGIVRGHRGAIKVESQPNKGTTVQVLFPPLPEDALDEQTDADQAALDEWRGSGTVLVIGGEVRNTGGEPLTVRLSDITLTSSAGMSAQRSAAPPLPWTIQPGQTQTIELQYEKPDASTALLTILGYSFEIRGLP